MTKDNEATKSNLTDSEIIEHLKGKKIQDIIDATNVKFFKWLKQILKLDIARTIDLCTFLINFSIAQNFFPWFNALYRFFPAIKEKHSLDDDLIAQFRESYERIPGILVLYCLKYDSKDKYTKGNTDREIDNLCSFGPLVEKFFVQNSLPYDLKVERALKISQEFTLMGRILPNLNFDPEFLKMIESKAFNQLFDTSFIEDFFEKGILKLRDIYPIPPNLYKEMINFKQEREKKFISINPELKISRFFRKDMNYFGMFFLGSPQQIDEIMTLLAKYYSDKIISKKKEIEKYLLCIGELLKLTEGKSLQKLNWLQIKERLISKVDGKFVEGFMEYAFLEAQYKEFDNKYKNFKGKDFLQEYHEFLKKVGYVYFGKVSTGVFLIWRGLIKYLETLQKEEEFFQTKGNLLELWCYEKAIEKGFRPEKLILINSESIPSERYKEMLKQTRNFPRRLQTIAKFPEGDISYFREIDLAIRANEYLFAFECKGTSAPIGEIGYYYNWIENLNTNYILMDKKIDILENNLRNGIITHPFVKGIKKIVIFQIQTEGIFAPYYTITTAGYLKLLDDIHENNNFQ